MFDKNGVILTNDHVIEGAQEIEVQLSDERVFPAKVVGFDKITDIGVLHVDAKDLRPLPLGDSDGIEVGDWAVAIGNPFGLSHTVSAGIISAKGRTKDDVPLDPAGYYNFLQTDASINPGNSGGPLLNLKGEVVGINSAIRGGGAQGIGFAIPINMVKQLLPMLLRDGHVTRSAMGVRIKDVRELAADDRQALKIPESDQWRRPGVRGRRRPGRQGGAAAGRRHRSVRRHADRALRPAPVAGEHGGRRSDGDGPRPAAGGKPSTRRSPWACCQLLPTPALARGRNSYYRSPRGEPSFRSTWPPRR